MGDETSCLSCGVPLERAPVGRPRRYCSTGCKRFAEHQVRRLTRRLDALAERRDTLLMQQAEIEAGTAWWAVGSMRESALRDVRVQLAAVDARVAEHEERLRTLLSRLADP